MNKEEVRIPALVVDQPIGEFYIGVVSFKDLLSISYADMRRIEGDLDRYVGIQRKLVPERLQEIGKFVNGIDATFPTSIVVAVPGCCASYDPVAKELSLFSGVDESSGEAIAFKEIAKILDGQHRIEGLKKYAGSTFDLSVSIFVEADLADQAYLFATVNLAQTKVNRSLVYDLLDYSKARSPQKSCHDVSVALDKHPSSPFVEMIKRLGNATPGRTGETLTQATFVTALLPFVSIDPQKDRELLARGKSLRMNDADYLRAPFRGLWVDGRDTDIARILIEYFGAVAERWPAAWNSREKGNILPRTNGFRAFMRFLKQLYLRERPSFKMEDAIIPRSRITQYLEAVPLNEQDFSSSRFPPGTSGEKKLFETLKMTL